MLIVSPLDPSTRWGCGGPKRDDLGTAEWRTRRQNSWEGCGSFCRRGERASSPVPGHACSPIGASQNPPPQTLRRFLLTPLVLLFLTAQLGFGRDPQPPKTVRIFTVGNSFSGNATRHLGSLAKVAGDTLILRSASVGGASLELHWKKVEAFEKNPDDLNGRYGNGKSLKEELASEPWDFVTIQQASIQSHDLATYRPFAQRLADYIRRHAPGATLLLHETWEYRVDDPRFSPKSPKPAEPKTQDEMHRSLATAYATIAQELGVRLIPVGDAFHLVDRDPQWGFRPAPFDPKSAQAGELPDQSHSLHVGWQWKKQPDGTLKLSMDGHHASPAGEYLGACVWYETIFGRNVENNAFVPAALNADDAKFLRAAAHRVVAGKEEAATR